MYFDFNNKNNHNDLNNNNPVYFQKKNKNFHS